jgi:hypothetical protein
LLRIFFIKRTLLYFLFLSGPTQMHVPGPSRPFHILPHSVRSESFHSPSLSPFLPHHAPPPQSSPAPGPAAARPNLLDPPTPLYRPRPHPHRHLVSEWARVSICLHLRVAVPGGRESRCSLVPLPVFIFHRRVRRRIFQERSLGGELRTLLQ